MSNVPFEKRPLPLTYELPEFTKVNYGSSELLVENSMLVAEMLSSMTDIFPELRNASVYISEDSSPKHPCVEFRIPASDSDEALWTMPTGPKESMEYINQASKAYDYLLHGIDPRKEVVVGSLYADKGNYQHLAGKKARVNDEYEDMKVTFITLENETKEYVIRNKDIHVTSNGITN